MKTLIILKGLAKNEKLEWVKSQGLENFSWIILFSRDYIVCLS